MTLYSFRSKQGKTWVANDLTRLCAETDQQVAYCHPRRTGKEQRPNRADAKQVHIRAMRLPEAQLTDLQRMELNRN